MASTRPPSFNTEPLRSWWSSPNGSIWKETKNAIGSLIEAILYAITPRVARPELPCDPPDPIRISKPVDEGTLEQCKEIYEQVESGRDYLDEKARSTFAVTAFLAPLLIAAITYLLTHSTGNSLSRTISLTISAIAFLFLVLGFISTVRALAVQGRSVLFLETVIAPNTPSIRPYDRTRHAQGLLYCASVNASFNAHIAQCVRSAHILTALAVIVAVLSTIPGFQALANQKEDTTKAEIIAPVAVKIDGSSAISTSIKQIHDEFLVSNGQINAINARLDALELKIKLASKHKRQPSEKPQKTPSCP